MAPDYGGSGKLDRHRRAHHRRRLRHRPRRGGAVRARRRRRRRSPTSTSTPTPRETQRASRPRAGAACWSPATSRTAALRRAGPSSKTVEAFGRLDVLVNNAAFQEHADVARGHHRRAPRGDLPHQHLRLLPHGPRRAAAPEAGRFDHQHRLGHRPGRAAPSCSTTRRPRAPSMRSPSRWRTT